MPSAIQQFNDLGPRLTPLLNDAREWARTIEPRALSSGIPGALISIPLVAVILVVVERLQARESPIALSPEKPPPEVAELLPDPDKS